VTVSTKAVGQHVYAKAVHGVKRRLWWHFGYIRLIDEHSYGEVELVLDLFRDALTGSWTRVETEINA